MLTLADQEVVGSGEGGGYALNEDSEMLENVNLAENWRRQKAKDLAKGEGRFSHYEGGPKDILSKYDESLGERKTLKLDATGSVDEAKQKKCAGKRLHATSARSAPRRPSNADAPFTLALRLPRCAGLQPSKHALQRRRVVLQVGRRMTWAMWGWQAVPLPTGTIT